MRGTFRYSQESPIDIIDTRCQICVGASDQFSADSYVCQEAHGPVQVKRLVEIEVRTKVFSKAGLFAQNQKSFSLGFYHRYDK